MKVAKIQFEIHFNFILGMYFLLVVVLNKKKDKNFSYFSTEKMQLSLHSRVLPWFAQVCSGSHNLFSPPIDSLKSIA